PPSCTGASGRGKGNVPCSGSASRSSASARVETLEQHTSSPSKRVSQSAAGLEAKRPTAASTTSGAAGGNSRSASGSSSSSARRDQNFPSSALTASQAPSAQR